MVQTRLTRPTPGLRAGGMEACPEWRRSCFRTHLTAAVGEARVACWWEGPKTLPRVVIIRNVSFLPLASLSPGHSRSRGSGSCVMQRHIVCGLYGAEPPSLRCSSFAVTMLCGKCQWAQAWDSAGAWRGCSRVRAFWPRAGKAGVLLGWEQSDQS